MRANKPLSPTWTTTVDPSEYDYVAHFTRTVKWSNSYKVPCPPTDVGRLWGLVASHQRLERENAALRHSEENLAATVRGLEFELEKAEKTAALLRGTVEALGDANDRLTIEISGLRKDKERLDWLNTHCMSADPIMGRSTYRWTIEHDEPDIRLAIAELRKAQV